MKVLMIAPYPRIGEAIRGGVETVSYNLVEGFKKTPEVDLRVLSICQKKDEIVELSPNVCIQYLKSKSPRRKIELKKHVKPFIRQINEEWQPDIIHIQGNGSALLLNDASYSHKFVITQHGVLQREIGQIKHLRAKFNMFLAILIENRLKKTVPNWIFISKYNRDFLFPSLNISYSALIYNPVNPKYFVEEKSRHTPVGPKALLFVGRLVPLKGLSDLLVGLAERRLQSKFKLHVIGGFEYPAYEQEIKQLVKDNNLQSTVVFHGWKTSEEIIEIEKECDALILPSHQETLPCVIAEAMAMGKVVIATNVGGIPEMINEGETGFMYFPGDKEGLVVALNKFSSLGEDEIISMEEASRQKAAMLYAPETVARQHIALYYKIANRL